MKKVMKFAFDRITPAKPAEHGHQCIVCRHPSAVTAQAEKARKKKKDGKTRSTRNTLIAKVKIAQKQLGIGDSDYRFMLQMNFGVSSCTELDETGLLKLITFFRSNGWQDKPAKSKAQDKHGRPITINSTANPAAPVLRRIEALLSELGTIRGRYVPWDYAVGILKKQSGIELLDAATSGELQKVMVALERTLQIEKRKCM